MSDEVKLRWILAAHILNLFECVTERSATIHHIPCVVLRVVRLGPILQKHPNTPSLTEDYARGSP